MTERIGFIGLGIMGKPMAMHLVNAGYPLTVLQSNKAAGELVAAGARAADSPKNVAAQSDVVITMLPD
ncbi:MAG: NAD(P)-binding domain-containing protein, partial [Anaerolineae bacterium]|nr:NAD(P)-binding domain-containing protein [Anaerolineae bacterium]